MRVSTWFRLATLTLIVGGIPAFCSQASAQRKPPATKKVLIEQEFKGFGSTQKLAEADALKEACDWLEKPDHFGWSPSPDYLREKGMVRFGEPSQEQFEFVKVEGVTNEGKMIVVPMQLEITADQARDIQKQAQNYRMKDRQKYSLLGLLGMMGLIGVVGGYLRLEEATKGYCTRLLRLAAIGILLAVIAGLCVIG